MYVHVCTCVFDCYYSLPDGLYANSIGKENVNWVKQICFFFVSKVLFGYRTYNFKKLHYHIKQLEKYSLLKDGRQQVHGSIFVCQIVSNFYAEVGGACLKEKKKGRELEIELKCIFYKAENDYKKKNQLTRMHSYMDITNA